MLENQQRLLQRQPVTHNASSKIWEFILCEDNTLSTEQIRAFCVLQDEANKMFEPPNERWDLVQQLHKQFFTGMQPQRAGKQWLKLGFQSQYPQSDFRGGGILSLRLILRFTKRNKDLVKIMSNDSGGFFFAITSINITFFLKKFFHLANFLIPGRDSHIYCNRRQLKNFCRVLVSSRDQCFYDMQQLLLKDFYEKLWIKEQIRYPQTLMRFNHLFTILEDTVKSAWGRSNIHNWQQFVNNWAEQLERNIQQQ